MIAQWRLFGIASPVYFMVILTLLAALLHAQHRLSAARSMLLAATAEAARAAGLNPERTVVSVFALHGLFAGIAGLLFATQLQVIQSTVPPNLELTIITASVIGGVSILGGTGTVVGSTLAAILFASHRLGADLPQCLGLLAALGVGSADPRHGAGRHDAAGGAQHEQRRLHPPRNHSRGADGHRAGGSRLCSPTNSSPLTICLNQGRLMAEVGLVALAMTFVIVTGGIDLSVGSILGLTAILLGVFWKNVGLPLPLAMVAGHGLRHHCRLGQRLHHHPLQSATADCNACNAGTLSRPCRRHQRSPLGAGLSRVVLSSSARAKCWACRCSSGCW